MIISGCFLTNSRPFMPFPYHLRTFPGHFSNIFTVYPRHLYPIPDHLVKQLVTIRCQFPSISDRFLAIRDHFFTIFDHPRRSRSHFSHFLAISISTISGCFLTISDHFRPFSDNFHHSMQFPDHFRPFSDCYLTISGHFLAI